MTTEYEFREVPLPKRDLNATKWHVRAVVDGKAGRWRRLYCTPRGKYYFDEQHSKPRRRIDYTGPAPAE